MPTSNLTSGRQFRKRGEASPRRCLAPSSRAKLVIPPNPGYPSQCWDQNFSSNSCNVGYHPHNVGFTKNSCTCNCVLNPPCYGNKSGIWVIPDSSDACLSVTALPAASPGSQTHFTAKGNDKVVKTDTDGNDWCQVNINGSELLLQGQHPYYCTKANEEFVTVTCGEAGTWRWMPDPYAGGSWLCEVST